MAKIVLKTNKPTTGDPNKDNDMVLSPSKPKIDSSFDVRDRLADLVAMGNNIKPDDKAAIYRSLISLYGEGKAQKILNHAYIFNNRADVQGLPVEQKLKTFYDIGSNDPEVNSILNMTKSLGYGVLPGLRESTSNFLAKLQKRGSADAVAGTEKPEVKEKVMLRVGK